MNTLLRAVLLTTPLLVAGCQSSPTPIDELGFVVPELEDSAQLERSVRKLERLQLEAELERGENGRRQRLWVAYFLSLVHSGAADAPFLMEEDVSGPITSPTAHLVAAVESAGLADYLFDFARELEVPSSVAHFAPSGMTGLHDSISIVKGVASSRLGFPGGIDPVLERSRMLRDPFLALGYLDAIAIPTSLRPWVCEMASIKLRETNELDAFRFAIMAIEAQERFGTPLPTDRIAELETWILEGADLRFVCPTSQTEYVPGQTRSPISGVPHLEYVAVERR